MGLDTEIPQRIVRLVGAGSLNVTRQLRLNPSYQRAVLGDKYKRAVEFCDSKVDAIGRVYIGFAAQSNRLSPAIIVKPKVFQERQS